MGDGREELLLAQLEQRRVACDQAMWQAPTLTIAGQSFLLALLANQDLATDVRRLVFIAGVLAVFAAVVALLRLRSREALYSEAIAAYSERLGIPDPDLTNSSGID